MEWLVRFLVGGAVVSLFATIADVLRPKGFAGLFGAAPSIALATLALTAAQEGGRYVSLEARSMLFGAIAMFFYAIGCVYLMARRQMKARVASSLMLIGGGAIALTLRFVLVGAS